MALSLKNFDNYDKSLAICLFAMMAVMLFVSHFHEMGGYNETDFYWSYAADAQNILSGEEYSEPDHGPGYVFILAGTSLIFNNMFFAGKIISILSTLAIVFFTFKLLAELFNKKVAFYSALVVFITFLPFSILVKSDIFFAAIVLMSLYFFFRNKTLSTANLVISGLIAGYAFITRYNAIFLPISAAGIFLLLNPLNWGWSQRIKGLLYYAAAFFVICLPWWGFNYFNQGEAMAQTNYLVVAMAFYGSGNYFGAEAKALAATKFDSLFSVIFYNPQYFFLQLFKNGFTYFENVLTQLVKFPLYLFFAPGLFLIASKKDKFVWSLLLFIVLGFSILILVQFWPRFYLYILPFFIFASVYFIFHEGVFKQPKFSYALLTISALFLMYYSAKETKANVTGEPTELFAVAEALRESKTGEGLLIARKPHLGFLSDTKTEYFPEVDSVDELLEFAKVRNASHLLYSDIEAELRPELKILQEPEKLPGELQLVYQSEMPRIFLYKLN